ncbi:MAG: 5-methyltetrahydropteroyltriglutamate--homocysteine S-methyltransferase [Gemmataceae bacterium]|nr:5-methyltetrahydropteroyltriglutamate--homocysteine S-methyltransferase [Gemmataceae bacterium]MDW8242315.1 5-methyltetrahydropteroyltriglutamate--homocysteine S-methyltransferase [Thermogemmata sp.]
MTLATNLGFPRIGRQRELKKALEQYWTAKISGEQLLETARQLRRTHWQLQREAGLDIVPCNDFSLYDHVLDTAVMVGAIPQRFADIPDELERYFAMARGGKSYNGRPGPLALEMTKWFDTNYHYLVPELTSDQTFRLSSTKPVDEFLEAQRLGYAARPVLVGPVTFLRLSKAKGSSFDPLQLLPRLLPVYEQILARLATAGATWVQMDEPILVTDTDETLLSCVDQAYNRLAAISGLKLLLTTYFGTVGEALPRLLQLPVAGIHLDLVRGPEQLATALRYVRPDFTLSLGLVDGRNVWRTDLTAALELARSAAARNPITVAPSCSLLHVPIDVSEETGIPSQVREWLAFARQKLEEVSLIARCLREGTPAYAQSLAENQAILERRRRSPLTNNPAVRARLAAVTPDMLRRQRPYSQRRPLQQARLQLPPFPTTTIGSFPQTEEVRKARAAFKAGKLSASDYEAFLKQQIAEAIRWQESIGIDVLVHGEFERNDMVEYFGEQLEGFVISSNGWVQSYGSRCVKPPIIYGDVARRGPMTVEWFRYAQSLTSKPVKGMLTGPVTILQWSFVRDDQPRKDTCWQIALAIRDEVIDLERAGAAIIQIDEPALREGLPLRKADWPEYLRWAVEAFRLASSGVRDDTQIHTHMCYSEFNDIIAAIADLDADVISIETSRSHMELLRAFTDFKYPNEIGPGVYDIHSPRIPQQAEMEGLLSKALAVLSASQLWVNPDCGLKTRRWEEVKPALQAMVNAARSLRSRLATTN